MQKNRIGSGKITVALSIALVIFITLSTVLGILLRQEKNGKIPAAVYPLSGEPRTEGGAEGMPEWYQIPQKEDALSANSSYNPEFMSLAIQNATNGVKEGKGGPVGAVIVKDGEIVASVSNENGISGYSFAHAEICAIRDAVNALGTRTLEGCELYSSAQPCLMCESAIAVAGIEKVYYAATLEDMLLYGYDDISEYEALRQGKNLVQSVAVERGDKTEPLELKKQYRAARKAGSSGPMHTNHTGQDVYGSQEYLDSVLLVTGNALSGEKEFTLSGLEDLASRNKDLLYTGSYSLMSGGGAFSCHTFSGIRLAEFLVYCGLNGNAPDDTPVTFFSLDGFSHTIPWGEIRNSRDNVYENKGDASPKYEKVPKILAFASDNVPLVGPVGNIELGHRFTAGEGYVESAENLGGPLRLVFGQRDAGHSNAPRNLQWIRQIIVGEDDFADVHRERLQREQMLRSNETLTVDEQMGEWAHSEEPYSKYLTGTLTVSGTEASGEKIYTLADLEKMQDHTVTDTFAASGGISVFRGILLKDLIQENLIAGLEMPSKVTVISFDGFETEVSVEDIMNGVQSKYQNGKIRDVILAYAVNGNPLVFEKEEKGFRGDNGTGPLQLVVENQISKWVKHVSAVRIGE